MAGNGAAHLNKAELFAALAYTPHAGQIAVHRSTASRRILACGVRWGKSTCAAHECVAALLAPCDDSLGWICAPTYTLSERIFRQVVGLVQRHFKARVRDYSEREHKLVVVNFGGGVSELRGKSADNPDSLLAEGLDYVIVDEAARLHEEIWHQHLSQRLIDKRGWALLLSTPQGKNWFWRAFSRGLAGRDPDFQSWRSPSWDNPHVDRALIEAERARNSNDSFAEQYEASFVGPLEGRCDTCGAPDSRVPTIHLGEEDDLDRECSACGFPVDAAGHTRVARFVNGQPNPRHRIIAQPRSDGTLPSIERCTPIEATQTRTQTLRQRCTSDLGSSACADLERGFQRP